MDMAVHLEGRLFLSLSLRLLERCKVCLFNKGLYLPKKNAVHKAFPPVLFLCDIFFLCYFLFQENINTGTHVLFRIPYLF